MSLIFDDIEDTILGIPYYEIPEEFKYIYHFLKKKINNDYNIPEEYEIEINEIINFNNILYNIKEYFMTSSNFKIISLNLLNSQNPS